MYVTLEKPAVLLLPYKIALVLPKSLMIYLKSTMSKEVQTVDSVIVSLVGIVVLVQIRFLRACCEHFLCKETTHVYTLA